jgi:hypothetical protein
VRLRHAAALALAGRYLMGPPPLSHSRGYGQIERLSRRIVARTFESKTACDAECRHLSKLAQDAEAYSYTVFRPKMYTTLIVSLLSIRASSHEPPPGGRARGLVIVDEGMLREAAEKLQNRRFEPPREP